MRIRETVSKSFFRLSNNSPIFLRSRQIALEKKNTANLNTILRFSFLIPTKSTDRLIVGNKYRYRWTFLHHNSSGPNTVPCAFHALIQFHTRHPETRSQLRQNFRQTNRNSQSTCRENAFSQKIFLLFLDLSEEASKIFAHKIHISGSANRGVFSRFWKSLEKILQQKSLVLFV